MSLTIARPRIAVLPRLRAAASAWLAAEQGRFFLFLPVCMAAGVVAYFARRVEPPLWPAAGLCIVCVGLAAALTRHPIARAAVVAVGVAAGGFASARVAAWRAPPWAELPRGAVVVTGTVREVEALPEGRRVTIAAPSLDGGAALARAVRIRLRDNDVTALQDGDVARVRCLLRPPSPPSYPGGWDMQRDAWFSGMAGYGFAIGPAVRLAGGGGGAVQGLREAVAARLMAALPGPRGAIAATLLTGLGAAIPAADRAAFQVSGLAHLLAVAGLHIGIVMGLVFGAVRTGLCLSEAAALHWPVKRIAALAALAGGLFYLVMTGAHVPILRSFAMACLVTLALLTGRRAVSARALALAALVLMTVAPELVVGVSFQMSFAAVLALVAGWEALSPRMALFGAGKWWRGPVLYVGGLAVTSALAGTASLPYAAYHFGTATLFYVPANMLAVPLTALWVMPWGLATLAAMPFGLDHVCAIPMGWGIDGLLLIAHGVAAWLDAVWPVPQMPPWGLLVFSAGLAWLCLWRSVVRFGGVAAMMAGLISPWLAASPDIVVSPDARVIAVRIGGQALVNTARGASRFDLDIPARVWGITARKDVPACPQGVCRFTVKGTDVVLVTDVAARCAGAAVIVSALPLRGACGSGAVVDRFSVLDTGATAISLGPSGVKTVTDRMLRGERPWVVTAPVHMATSRLPPAATE